MFLLCQLYESDPIRRQRFHQFLKRGEEGRERRGRIKSRNIYKGPMDKDSGGGIEYGRWGVRREGESNGVKWGQLKLNHNLKII